MINSLSEIWSRRSLIITLAISDLKLRYRNSVLGFFWSFLEPLLLLTILYFIFTNVFKSDIEHYPLFLLLGIIMWSGFSRGSNGAMESILSKAGLVSQVYLPREVLILSAVITSFLMLFLEMIVFFIFMIAFQVFPGITIVILPLLIVNLFIITLGISLPLAAGFVYYRDLKSIWTVILQAGFFVTPIIYSLQIFPENIQSILSLNPLVPLFELIRDVTIYNSWPTFNESNLYMIGFTISLILLGYAIFKKLDKRIVEAI